MLKKVKIMMFVGVIVEFVGLGIMMLFVAQGKPIPDTVLAVVWGGFGVSTFFTWTFIILKKREDEKNCPSGRIK